MKKRKLILFALILSFILFFGTVGNVIIMNTAEKLSENNTTEFMVTIESVGIEGEGTYEHCIIYSEEYGDKLSTYSVREMVDISDFNSLKTGQIVFFRTKNIWIDQFEKMSFIPIISIRTEKEELVSLDKYNEYTAHSLFAPTIAGIIVAIILLLTSIHFILLLRGINVFRRKK